MYRYMQKVEEISREGAKNLKNFQTNIVKHVKSSYTFKKNIGVCIMAQDNKQTTKRTIRPKEERIAIIDQSIEFHKKAIEKLEQKKKNILNPKSRTSTKTQMKTLLNKIQESGMTIEEIAEKLGVKTEE